jgi:hypothetical protein
MLVHVTRFQDVQAAVTAQVQEALDHLKRQLRHGGESSNRLMMELRALWEADFIPVAAVFAPEHINTPWASIEAHLLDVCSAIQVRTINGLTGDVLDYDAYRETGLDVVAVGGDKLARGLTLEGLTTSYFLRASKMYDTLMQMGRWSVTGRDTSTFAGST